MANIIINLSRIATYILMVCYTFSCFTIYREKDKEIRDSKLNHQVLCVFIIHFLSYMTLALAYPDKKNAIVVFYGMQILVAILYMYLYHVLYPYSNRIITNNMHFLLLIGYTMLTRLNFSLAKKQFAIATVTMIGVTVVPYIMDKTKNLRNYNMFYGIIGILALASVFVIGQEHYGSRNWISLFGISIQPSELVKILFVFFIASMLSKSRDFKQVMITTAFAAVHMGILVLEKDLGAALIFFIIFIFIIYI